MAEPQFWMSRTHPAVWALRPLGALYGKLVALRRRYTVPDHMGKPVICVGNFTAGGAGKTPVTRHIANMLAAAGHAPAIISRGHGGRETGPLRVDTNVHSAAEIGDEPLMLARDHKVYVARDRRAAARLAISEGADSLIKDDGFQNPTMRHAVNVLVVDAASGVGNGLVLPAGPLREFLPQALARADALVISYAGQASLHPSIVPLISAFEANARPVLRAEIALAPLAATKACAFCGIAKPAKFAASLTDAGVSLVGMRAFADHHAFSDAEAQSLLDWAAAADAPLLTTEKDMARLAHAPVGSPRARLAAATECVHLSLKLSNEARLATLLNDALTRDLAAHGYRPPNERDTEST